VCISEPKEVHGKLISGERQRAQQSMGHIEISQLGLVLADLTAKVVKATSELEDQYVNAQDAF
jgi:signal transduction histidine kinase